VLVQWGNFSTVSVLARLTHQPTGIRENLLRNLDLSKSRSLRSLEIPAKSVSVYSFVLLTLKVILLTIRSPVFSEVVIVLEGGSIDETCLSQRTLFRFVQGMHDVKPFRLVFCLEIWEGDRDETAELLRRYIDAEAAKGGLDFLPSPPTIVFNTRATRGSKWEGLRA